MKRLLLGSTAESTCLEPAMELRSFHNSKLWLSHVARSFRAESCRQTAALSLKTPKLQSELCEFSGRDPTTPWPGRELRGPDRLGSNLFRL